MNRRAKKIALWVGGGVVGVVVLVLAASFIYVNFIKDDPPDRLTVDDLTEAVSGTTVSDPSVATQPATTVASPASSPATTSAPVPASETAATTAATTAVTTAGGASTTAAAPP